MQASVVVSPQDEPEAHALYNQMVGAMRKAKSLSYVSHYTFEAKNIKMECTYRAWLKKPNYFRVEVDSASDKNSGIFAWLENYFREKPESTAVKISGILIGDGNTLWIYWPGGRPFWRRIRGGSKITPQFLHAEARPAGRALHRP